MKVCVIGHEWRGNTTGIVVNAFRQAGCEVQTVCWEYGYRVLGSKRLGSYSQRCARKMLYRYCYRLNHRRIMAALTDDIDLAFVIIGTVVHADTIKAIKERFSFPVCLWAMDDPLISWGHPPTIRDNKLRAYSYYDYVFLYDSYGLDQCRSHFGDKFHHLPLSYDPDIFQPVDVPNEYAVSFIGMRFPERYELLKTLSEVNLDVWGSRFDELTNVRRHPVVTPAEANRIYNQSKVNINITHRQSIWGNNSRVYEVAGSGNLLITDYKKELEDQFALGQELVTYRDKAEFREKALYYLEHQDEAATIGRAAAKRAASQHTCRHRMEQVLKIAGGAGK